MTTDHSIQGVSNLNEIEIQSKRVLYHAEGPDAGGGLTWQAVVGPSSGIHTARNFRLLFLTYYNVQTTTNEITNLN